jgi:hypothetical protein
MNVLSESDKVVYEDEVWKPCPDFENKYLISNYGRIKSISSVSKEYSIPTSNISKCCKGSILSIHGRVFLYKNSDILEKIKMLNKRTHKSKTENVR